MACRRRNSVSQPWEPMFQRFEGLTYALSVNRPTGTQTSNPYPTDNSSTSDGQTQTRGCDCRQGASRNAEGGAGVFLEGAKGRCPDRALCRGGEITANRGVRAGRAHARRKRIRCTGGAGRCTRRRHEAAFTPERLRQRELSLGRDPSPRATDACSRVQDLDSAGLSPRAAIWRPKRTRRGRASGAVRRHVV